MRKRTTTEQSLDEFIIAKTRLTAIFYIRDIYIYMGTCGHVFARDTLTLYSPTIIRERGFSSETRSGERLKFRRARSLDKSTLELSQLQVARERDTIICFYNIVWSTVSLRRS